MLDIFFPSGTLGFGCLQSRSAPLVGNTPQTLSQHISGDFTCVLCDSTLLGPLVVWALFSLPYEPFSFADFAFYPFSTVNHNLEYESMLSPCVFLENHQILA